MVLPLFGGLLVKGSTANAEMRSISGGPAPVRWASGQGSVASSQHFSGMHFSTALSQFSFLTSRSWLSTFSLPCDIARAWRKPLVGFAEVKSILTTLIPHEKMTSIFHDLHVKFLKVWNSWWSYALPTLSPASIGIPGRSGTLTNPQVPSSLPT